MSINVRQLRKSIIAEARGEIGYRYRRGTRNKYAVELGAPWLYSAPYCGTFVTAILARVGVRLTAVISNPYYVPTLVNEAKAKGIFVTTPQDGDIALFEWHGLPSRNPDHTGFANPSRGRWVSVEGNTSKTNAGSQGNGGWVAARTRRAGQVIGYISISQMAARFPNAFGDVGDYAPRVWITSPRVRAMSSNEVKELQALLIKAGHGDLLGKWGADGKYGEATTRAVMAAQEAAGVTVDGVAGPDTLKALRGPVNGSESPDPTPAPSKPKKPAKGAKIAVDGYLGRDTVRAFQVVRGSKYRDGILSRQPRNQITQAMSPGTVTFSDPPSRGSDTVRDLQRLVGVTADGRLGVDTFTALQRFLRSAGGYKGRIDGRMDRPSKTVKAFQKWLNART